MKAKHPASITMGEDQHDAMLWRPKNCRCQIVPKVEVTPAKSAPRGAHLHEQGFETRSFRAMLDTTEGTP
ncbi:MAG: hypothetical protein CMK96_06385 [Pseudomonas sp.]|nr:hypothetical protein [Pseudomonas sp.]QDP67261.1 MAG: hypothetical protein GOVbin7368_52 [Prokaryotic dsDNA virus sp.]